MKSIAEIADELSVSKTSIYKILKKNEELFGEHIQKKQGKTLLDEHVERFLENYYASEAVPGAEEVEIDLNEVKNDSNLLNLIAILQKQIEVKDDQLNSLYQLNQSLLDLLNREQQLRIAEKAIEIQEQSFNNKFSPKSFFKKIFKK